MFAKATFGPRHAATIGAASSALLLGVLGVVSLLSTRDGLSEKEFWDFMEANPELWGSYVRDYFLYPAMIGGLAGSVVGWALWATLTGQRVSAFALVSAWGILGGVVGFLLAIGSIVGLLSMSGGNPVGRDGSGGGAVFLATLEIVVLGSVVGSVIGAIVGAMKARTRKQR